MQAKEEIVQALLNANVETKRAFDTFLVDNYVTCLYFKTEAEAKACKAYFKLDCLPVKLTDKIKSFIRYHVIMPIITKGRSSYKNAQFDLKSIVESVVNIKNKFQLSGEDEKTISSQLQWLVKSYAEFHKLTYKNTIAAPLQEAIEAFNEDTTIAQINAINEKEIKQILAKKEYVLRFKEHMEEHALLFEFLWKEQFHQDYATENEPVNYLMNELIQYTHMTIDMEETRQAEEQRLLKIDALDLEQIIEEDDLSNCVHSFNTLKELDQKFGKPLFYYLLHNGKWESFTALLSRFSEALPLLVKDKDGHLPYDHLKQYLNANPLDNQSVFLKLIEYTAIRAITQKDSEVFEYMVNDLTPAIFHNISTRLFSFSSRALPFLTILGKKQEALMGESAISESIQQIQEMSFKEVIWVLPGFFPLGPGCQITHYFRAADSDLNAVQTHLNFLPEAGNQDIEITLKLKFFIFNQILIKTLEKAIEDPLLAQDAYQQLSKYMVIFNDCASVFWELFQVHFDIKLKRIPNKFDLDLAFNTLRIDRNLTAIEDPHESSTHSVERGKRATDDCSKTNTVLTKRQSDFESKEYTRGDLVDRNKSAAKGVSSSTPALKKPTTDLAAIEPPNETDFHYETGEIVLAVCSLGWYLLLKEQANISITDDVEQPPDCGMAIALTLLFLTTASLTGIGYGLYVLARQSECLSCFFSKPVSKAPEEETAQFPLSV